MQIRGISGYLLLPSSPRKSISLGLREDGTGYVAQPVLNDPRDDEFREDDFPFAEKCAWVRVLFENIPLI